MFGANSEGRKGNKAPNGPRKNWRQDLEGRSGFVTIALSTLVVALLDDVVSRSLQTIQHLLHMQWIFGSLAFETLLEEKA